jgi:uncharacterized Tic20 family protein
MAGKEEKKRRKKQSLHLTDKKHPGYAIVATILGIVSIVLFIALCFVSSQSHGKAGLLIGVAGMGCVLLSMTGFILSWMTLHQENIRPLFPTIASVLNGLSIVFYLLLYLWGRLL